MTIDLNSINPTNRLEYLDWRKEWRLQYKELSKEIREIKKSRKQFRYEYRPKDNTAMKRRWKIGPNPSYDPYANSYWASYRATLMLKRYKVVKDIARSRREIELKEAA